jgi:hypothetical protein
LRLAVARCHLRTTRDTFDRTPWKVVGHKSDRTHPPGARAAAGGGEPKIRSATFRHPGRRPAGALLGQTLRVAPRRCNIGRSALSVTPADWSAPRRSSLSAHQRASKPALVRPRRCPRRVRVAESLCPKVAPAEWAPIRRSKEALTSGRTGGLACRPGRGLNGDAARLAAAASPGTGHFALYPCGSYRGWRPWRVPSVPHPGPPSRPTPDDLAPDSST